MNSGIVKTPNGDIEVFYKKTAKGTWVSYEGKSWFVPAKSMTSSGEAKEEDITAPMTGKVVTVEVSESDEVEEGQVVVILEAMKMEYRLSAPRAGKIEAINCKKDDLVDIGKILVSLEEE